MSPKHGVKWTNHSRSSELGVAGREGEGAAGEDGYCGLHL